MKVSKSKSKVNKTKKTPRDKYALGSFVEGSREISQQYQDQIDSLVKPQGGGAVSGALSAAGTGAAVGSAFTPLGGLIGAGVGALGGLLFGGIRDRKEREAYTNQINQLNASRSNLTKDLYESSLDVNNQNPYGVYKDGGDVDSPINSNTEINIEKGELQIDPNTGKILRKYTGINPETGGLYKEHNKKGKDPKDNMVTAEEGTFIITKKEAKKYEEAVDNNDKLYQNTIMSNIRNQKPKGKPRKYQTGGIVDPNILYQMPLAGVNPNTNINIPNSLGNRSLAGNNTVNLTSNSPNLGNIASTAINYLPSIYNMVQGSKRANTMPFTPVRMNVGNRQRILSNLPTEVSNNPALNNIRNARNRAYRGIDRNTANPTIARANRLSLESNFLDSENQAAYNNQLVNNQIRAQRAGILSGLEGQDQARSAQNVQNLNQTLLTNRQMQLAKEQQFNTGLSQAQQMFQNNRRNRQLGDMDQRTLELLTQIFPNTGNLFDSWRGGNR